MTTVDAPTVEQAELAAVVSRVLADLSVPPADVPLTVAALILGRPNIATALAGAADLPQLRRTVDQLRVRHRPVLIAPRETRYVCAATRKHPESCPDCRVLWGDPTGQVL